MLQLSDWLSIAGLCLNALLIPVLVNGAKWIFKVERRLTVVETLQSGAITTLVNRHRADDRGD
jgi:hypothetical protein